MSFPGSVFDGLRKGHLDIRRRRLLLHCWHRGTQEIDLLRGSFAETCLGDF
jgi:succinate dehydrogenase flavin-adding protein (antitoxin of CptAB toxin-antitoxin module)